MYTETVQEAETAAACERGVEIYMDMQEIQITACALCPRACGADRTRQAGYCGGGPSVKAARAALHFWEEPCISGSRGSGAIFFSGCPLRCCFCQNHSISAGNFGKALPIDKLSDIFLELQEAGAHNINLVSPMHYAPWVLRALDRVKHRLSVPVVCNSSGYERVSTLQMFAGYIDVYLPDLKYADSERAARYSGAPDYFEAASHALPEMFRQTGGIQMDEQGILRKGMVIRHLVMPKGRFDSLAVLDWIAAHFAPEDIMVSIMSQFTPFYRSSAFPEINRRVSTFEYNTVVDRAVSLGLQGYMQEKSAAKEEYTPLFDLTGVE